MDLSSIKRSTEQARTSDYYTLTLYEVGAGGLRLLVEIVTHFTSSSFIGINTVDSGHVEILS
jgi:hypothetical protein